jgi:hypothetical protein
MPGSHQIHTWCGSKESPDPSGLRPTLEKRVTKTQGRASAPVLFFSNVVQYMPSALYAIHQGQLFWELSPL